MRYWLSQMRFNAPTNKTFNCLRGQERMLQLLGNCFYMVAKLYITFDRRSSTSPAKEMELLKICSSCIKSHTRSVKSQMRLSISQMRNSSPLPDQSLSLVIFFLGFVDATSKTSCTTSSTCACFSCALWTSTLHHMGIDAICVEEPCHNSLLTPLRDAYMNAHVVPSCSYICSRSYMNAHVATCMHACFYQSTHI